ncbi:MAG: Hpt domain-containing protein [Hyphomicrobiaceae bacterium]
MHATINETKVSPLPINAREALLPLIDQAAMDEWCRDLEPEDIQDVLRKIPTETHQSMGLIYRAIEASDLGMARRAAHRLKGMAATLGAARLAHEAKALELDCQNLNEFSTRLGMLERTLADSLVALAPTV